MAKVFELHTPLMWLDKARPEAWSMTSEAAGLVDLVREHSQTAILARDAARARLGLWLRRMPGLAR